jgi:hypothetical protein
VLVAWCETIAIARIAITEQTIAIVGVDALQRYIFPYFPISEQ